MSSSENGTKDLRWKYNALTLLQNKQKRSHDCNAVGSLFQILGAATEKARLPRHSLVLGTESCCDVDGLGCRRMFL